MSKRTEEGEQMALFDWAARSVGRLPELALLYAIPNGGHRRKAVAGKLKAQGVKRGVPDVCLPVARNGFKGLYIELKTLKGKLSDEQRWWLEKLKAEGYYAVCVRGFEMAKECLEIYLAYEQKTECDL